MSDMVLNLLGSMIRCYNIYRVVSSKRLNYLCGLAISRASDAAALLSTQRENRENVAFAFRFVFGFFRFAFFDLLSARTSHFSLSLFCLCVYLGSVFRSSGSDREMIPFITFPWRPPLEQKPPTDLLSKTRVLRIARQPGQSGRC